MAAPTFWWQRPLFDGNVPFSMATSPFLEVPQRGTAARYHEVKRNSGPVDVPSGRMAAGHRRGPMRRAGQRDPATSTVTSLQQEEWIIGKVDFTKTFDRLGYTHSRAESLENKGKPMIPRGSAVLPAGGPVTAWKRSGSGQCFLKRDVKAWENKAFLQKVALQQIRWCLTRISE